MTDARTRPGHVPPRRLVEIDYGDQELVVSEYPDGLYTVEIDDGPRLLVNEDQLQQLVGEFMRLGKEKGWT